MTFNESFAACLAELLGIDSDAIPLAGAEDVPARAHEWLATRGLGLIEVRDPAAFGWPVPWIARVPGVGAGGRAVLAFGAPPGIVGDPAGEPTRAGAPLLQGWVVASLQRPRASTFAAPGASTSGTVEALLLAPEARAPMERATRAELVAGRGARGDRYFEGAGTFSDPAGAGHDLTLVEGEALDELGVSAEDARRNVVTRGVDLDALIGRRFRIGGAECVGRRRCEPCAHLERLGPPGILRALVHRGGLRADVLSDGTVAPGATVAAV